MNPKDPTETDRKVAVNIRRIRRLKEISQTTIALELGVTFQQFQKYEKGTNRITVGRFVQIADVLGVDIQELLK